MTLAAKGASQLLWLVISLTLLTQDLRAQTLSIAPERSTAAKIAIILDDIGYNRANGERALALNGSITYAILPFTPFSTHLANLAHRNQQEVMVHVPMQSTDPNQVTEMGSIAVGLSEHEIRQRVDQALEAVPYSIGFNNHMGSYITANQRIMHWVMQQARKRKQFFIDSRTTVDSVALKSAQMYGIPTLKRDVFLDNIQTPEAIAHQFQRLVSIAQRQGFAIAIGHPYPATLRFLEHTLPELTNYQVQLVPVSKLVAEHGQTPPTPLQPESYLRWLVRLPPPLSQRLDFSSY